MSLSYKDKLSAIVSILQNHATSTATPFLSENLTYRVEKDNVFGRNPETMQLKAEKLPCVFVRVSSADETFGGIGPTGSGGVKKFKEVIFDVIGFYGKPGGHSSDKDLIDEVYELGENIEAVFREKYNLSQTALWCNPEATDFLGPFDVEGSQVKTVFIKVRAKYLFR